MASGSAAGMQTILTQAEAEQLEAIELQCQEAAAQAAASGADPLTAAAAASAGAEKRQACVLLPDDVQTLKNELQRGLLEGVSEEVRSVGLSMRKDIREELRRCFASVVDVVEVANDADAAAGQAAVSQKQPQQHIGPPRQQHQQQPMLVPAQQAPPILLLPPQPEPSFSASNVPARGIAASPRPMKRIPGIPSRGIRAISPVSVSSAEAPPEPLHAAQKPPGSPAAVLRPVNDAWNIGSSAIGEEVGKGRPMLPGAIVIEEDVRSSSAGSDEFDKAFGNYDVEDSIEKGEYSSRLRSAASDEDAKEAKEQEAPRPVRRVATTGSQLARSMTRRGFRSSALPKIAPNPVSSGKARHISQKFENFIAEMDLPEVPSWQDYIFGFVRSNVFDSMVCVLLVVNAISMGAQVDHQVRAGPGETPTAHLVVEITFCVLFSAELALRFSVSKLAFFVGPGWGWNLFDSSLVFLQVLETIITLVGPSEGSVQDKEIQSSATAGTSLRVMRMIRILRLLRVIRLLRLVRFIIELRKLLYLIIASFWSFIWTGVLLIILTYIVALFFTQMVVDHELFDDQQVMGYFGSLGDSLFSLYKAITGGVDWEVMSSCLVNAINPWMGIVFAMYVAFAVLVLLNLVTGVFVDGAMKLSKDDKEAELLRKVNRAFRDKDANNGMITWEDITEKYLSQEMHDLFKAMEINISRAEELFKVLDEDASGSVTAEEFAIGALKLQGPATALDLAMMAQQQQKDFVIVRQELKSVQDLIRRQRQLGTKPASPCGWLSPSRGNTLPPHFKPKELRDSCQEMSDIGVEEV